MLRRKKRSLRKVPRATSLSRLRLVAQMMRTSTFRPVRRPRRCTSFPSIARRILACACRAEFADLVEEQNTSLGKFPVGLGGLWAPVNAPRSYPKSSLSRRASGRAAQLTNETNRPRPPVAVGMHQLGRQFFARSGLTSDQYIAFGGSYAGDPGAYIGHRQAAAHDALTAAQRQRSGNDVRRQAAFHRFH